MVGVFVYRETIARRLVRQHGLSEVAPREPLLVLEQSKGFFIFINVERDDDCFAN